MKSGYFLILFLILSVYGCSKTGDTSKKEDSTGVAVTSQVKSTNKSKDIHADYTGFLDGKYAIVLQLDAVQGQVTGRYFYKSSGTDILLRGTLDESGHLKAEEHDSKGTVTGIFEAEVHGKAIDGKWFPPNRAKSMNAYLETTETAYETWQLVAQTTKKHNFMEYRSPGPVPLGPGSANKSCYFSWKYPAAWETYGKGMAGNYVQFQYDEETWLILYHTYTEKKFPDQALHDIYSRKIVNANDDVLYTVYQGNVGDRFISESLFMDYLYSGTFAWTDTRFGRVDWMCIMYVQVHNSPYMETIDGEEKGVYPVSVVLGNSSQAKFESNRVLFDAIAASSRFDCDESQ